jgi:hypothetical protein
MQAISSKNLYYEKLSGTKMNNIELNQAQCHHKLVNKETINLPQLDLDL